MPHSIADRLGQSAEQYSTRAFAAYVEGSTSDFFLFAGIALEHAIKAKLARAQASYVAPNGNFGAALALDRFANDVDALPHGTKTIGALVALSRLKLLDPSVNLHSESICELFEFRNGEAHLAVGDTEALSRAVVAFLRAVNALLNPAPEVFWRPNHELVSALLDANAAEVKVRVEQKLAAARQAFLRGIGAMPDALKDAALNQIETNRDRVTHDEELGVECPACGSPALVAGFNDVEPDEDAGEVWFNSTSLTCEACGLNLDSADETELAGIEPFIHPTMTTADFYADFEPDWDYLSDR